MLQRFIVFMLFCALFINVTKAQTWSDAGATWHYNYSSWQTKGILEIKYIKDTLINSISCKVLQKKHDWYELSGKTFHTEYLENEYVYENNSVVYRYKFSQFDTLYNFDANVGDQWKIAGSSKYGTACDSTGYLVVDSIGTTVINSLTLRYICVSPKAASNWGSSSKIIEKIGPVKNLGFQYLSYMFPTKRDNCGMALDEITEAGNFRCYSDNNFQYHLLDAQTPSCDFIIGVEEVKKISNIVFFPNPAKDFITLQNLESTPIKITIYDLLGQIVIEKETNANKTIIDLTNVNNGIYSVCTSALNKPEKISRTFICVNKNMF